MRFNRLNMQSITSFLSKCEGTSLLVFFSCAKRSDDAIRNKRNSHEAYNIQFLIVVKQADEITDCDGDEAHQIGDSSIFGEHYR